MTLPTRMWLDKPGLTMFLGSIETSVMIAVWDGCKTKHAIYNEIVANNREWAHSSVSTVIERLVLKGLLTKTNKGKYAIYTPVYTTEQEFIIAVIQHATRAMIDEFDDTAYETISDTLQIYYDNVMSRQEDNGYS